MKLRMRQAVSLAMADAMRADPAVVLWGEDVGAAGGVFKTSEGLLDEFGPERVRDTPISEMGFLGAAVGAAMTGLRPVVEIMFMDFLGVAFDQLVTQAAKMRYMSRGQFCVPLVVRGSAGAGLGYGAQHSQSVEPWFQSVAGLTVVSPSSPSSAYGLLRSAIRSDDPVLFIEPRSLYGVREDFVPGDDAVLPLGASIVRRPGADATVLALGATVRVALDAASASRRDLEVVDLACVRPWDEAGVLASVARTGRLVIVEESPRTGGWGATIAAHVSQELWGRLRSPVLRVTSPDGPIPYAEELEKDFTPTAEAVLAAVERAMSSGRESE